MFPLETERLIIDTFQASDKEAYFRNITHDRKVLETFICPYTETLEELDFSKYVGSKIMFAVRLKASDQLIGIILYFDAADEACEFGYAIGSGYWKQGYATEAARRFIRFLFEEKGFQTVYASFFVGNDASRRVMEKCGMTYDHVAEEPLTYLGQEKDLVFYSIHNTEN